MRIKIDLSFDLLIIPLDYQHALQAFIYKNMSPKYANKYHLENQGIIKPFTFSRIMGDFTIKAERLVFANKAYFYFSSYDDSLVLDICKNLSSVNNIYDIFSNKVRIDGVHILTNFSSNNKAITYKTISPVILYRNNEMNKRIYPAPSSQIYTDLLISNINKKLSQFNLEPCEVNILDISNIRKGVYKYKKYMYTGFDFDITIKADDYVHSLIQDVGIGYRNPIGFGMIERL